jgi:hypothetical protein
MPSQIKYYRNIIPIEQIEDETLWILQDNLIILVDEDDPVNLPADIFLKHFYQVQKPPELK